MDLARIPKPDELLTLLRGAAFLEAVLEADWSLQNHHFDKAWSPPGPAVMASCNDGAGAKYFCVLRGSDYAFCKGIDFHSELHRNLDDLEAGWRALAAQVPAKYAAEVAQPAFYVDEGTFALWWDSDAGRWVKAENPCPQWEDGAEDRLAHWSPSPGSFHAYAEEYFDRELPRDLVAKALRGEPLTRDEILAINPEVDWEVLRGHNVDIGYPAELG